MEFKFIGEKMNILVILGHPDKNSFNHAIANIVIETLKTSGHSVIFHDLYAEEFDPMLGKEEIPENGIVSKEIQEYCKELQLADGIIVIHPNWWGQPPAILKGWIDRVFRPGVAYRFEEQDSGEGVPIGLLHAEAALIFNTSNTEEKREHAVFGDPLELLWKNCIFELCGVQEIKRRMFNIVITSSLEQRQEWLKEVKKTTEDLFPG